MSDHLLSYFSFRYFNDIDLQSLKGLMRRSKVVELTRH